ncbi:hypothetical protein GST45_17695 [Serratia marcescens]|uniref:Uncharacterized protein n=1 Tax=Serratia marcescens TaxID=615 RepID=A0ABD5BHR2_SERMA|nr:MULTISPECIES: hypothetical protein [Yersiniaceae]MCZ6928691.1 hypothetical protein [Serratia marcescens]MDE5234344.1 hypothetical protein [Serratia marcescens]MDE5257489.1 hypothetical protein [Serratia marcescens]MDQ9402299.1 hypothetical protein [Serratia marcescens]MDQ9424650.1 hypothetical protein [Serratia marcescens]
MAKAKPYTCAARNVFHKLAAVMVCMEIEKEVIAPAYEKAGKPYDPKSPDSFTNTFLNNNAEYKRAWETFARAIKKERRSQLEMARSKHGR